MILSALSIAALIVIQAEQAEPGNLSAPGTCIAALQYPGVAGANVEETERHVAGWRRVMLAVNSDMATHQTAIDGGRIAFDNAEARRVGMGVLAAEAFARNCRSQGMQARFVARFASAEAAAQYQSESGHD